MQELSFDDFNDLVEKWFIENKGWNEIQFADFISPRTIELIKSYKSGFSIEHTSKCLLETKPTKQYWD